MKVLLSLISIFSVFVVAFWLSYGRFFNVFILSISPLSYQGDMLATLWNITNISDNILQLPSRVNYPYGYDYYDYPSADLGLFSLFSIFHIFSSNFIFTINFLYLLSFVVVYVVTFICTFYVSHDYTLAFFLSILYTFTPFHFLRLDHIFYTYYVLPPIFIVIAIDLYHGTGAFLFPSVSKVNLLFTRYLPLLLIFTLFCNIYYMFFGCVAATLSLFHFDGRLFRRSVLPTYFLVCFLVLLSLLLNNSQYLINRIHNGPNFMVAKRQTVETELYALKPYTLLLPRADHRIAQFRSPIKALDTSSDTEQVSSAAGIAGTIGFLVAIYYALNRKHIRATSPAAFLFLYLLFTLLWISMPGSLNSIFALFISPSIRAWNRVSIYLIYFLYYFFCTFTLGVLRSTYFLSRLQYFFLSLIIVLCVLDQTVSANPNVIAQSLTRYQTDQRFFSSIESTLDPYSAVYQLPYQLFPEASPIFDLGSYDLATALIHTKTTKWTWGGTHGRPGDRFFQDLNKLPLATRITILSSLNIRGIVINLLGYPDHGTTIQREAAETFGRDPDLTNDSRTQIFYKLPAARHALLPNPATLIDTQKGTLRSEQPTVIDFTARKLSDAVCATRGFSGWEPNGRWTDAQLSDTADIVLCNTLPAKFRLTINASTFGPNANGTTTLRTGLNYYFLSFSILSSSISIDVSTLSQSNSISFVPPLPISPHSLGLGDDMRKLGIQLHYIHITPLD